MTEARDDGDVIYLFIYVDARLV